MGIPIPGSYGGFHINAIALAGCYIDFIHDDVTVLSAQTAIPTAPLPGRRCIIIYNNSTTVTVFLGANGLTAGNGFPLPPQSSIVIDATDDIDIFGRTASGSADVRTLELA